MKKQMENAQEYLRSLGRSDLAILLTKAKYHIVEVDDFWVPQPTIHIMSHKIIADALSSLQNFDVKRIVDAIKQSNPDLADVEINEETIVTKWDESIELEPKQELLGEIICQKNMMVDVATGGERINNVNDYYRARRIRITNGLSVYGFENPNPHDDLWDWYHKWSSDFSSYAERRSYINELISPIINQLISNQVEVIPHREPTGWDRVDRVIKSANERLEIAHNEEDYQAIGLLCREILISLGQAVYDPNIHESPDGVELSKTDAKRQLLAFIGYTVPGKSNETIRRHAKASLSLALDLQHRRTANFRLAAMCLEATSSTVNIIAILSGRRDQNR